MDEVKKEPVLQIHPHLSGVGGAGDVHVPRDRVRAAEPAPKLPADGGGVEDQGDRGHEQQRRERPSLRAAVQASSCAPPCQGSKSSATGIFLFSFLSGDIFWKS